MGKPPWSNYSLVVFFIFILKKISWVNIIFKFGWKNKFTLIYTIKQAPINDISIKHNFSQFWYDFPLSSQEENNFGPKSKFYNNT